MLRKPYLSLCALILTILMLVQAAPLQSLAESMGSQAVTSQTESDEPNASEETAQAVEATIIRELESGRGESVKRFEMSDGTILAAQYPSPVHYLEDGQWKDIDNTLTEQAAADSEDEEGYASAKSQFQVKFAKKYDAKKLVKIKMDDYQLSWSFSGANSAKAKNAKVQTEADTDDAADEDQTNLKKLTSGVTYADIQDGVDLEYILSSTTLKENIVVKKKLDDYRFELVLRPKKLTPVLREDNCVDFVNDAQEVVFQIPAPFMYDAAGAESPDVALALTSDGKGKEYTLTITANAEWMNDTQRQYPVVIDPVIIKESEHLDAYSSGYMTKYPDGTWERNPTTAHLYIGEGLGTGNRVGEQRAYLIPQLPPLSADDRVCEAYLYLCQLGNASGVGIPNQKFRINVHQITQSWSSNTISWNIGLDSDIMDTKDTDCLDGGWDKFDITRAVKEWHDNGNNYGVMFIADQLSGGDGRRYVSTDAQNTSYDGFRPSVIVKYFNTTGLNDFNSYKSYDMGSAGTLYANEYTGAVTHIVNDVSYGGNFPSITINHVNNTSWKDNANAYGRGWLLNISEKITEISGDQLPERYRYRYRDEDGTEIYFLTKESGSGFEDEVGRGLELTHTSGATYPYTITFKDGTKKKYNYDGYLCQIEYTDGKTTTITLSNNLPTKITDYAGRTATFTYSSGRLSQLSLTGGRKITYDYDSTGRLLQIHHYDGLVSEYAYDPSNRFVAVFNDTMRLGIDYYDNNRLKALYEQPWPGGTAHDILWVDYLKDKTIFTHPGPSNNVSSTCSDRLLEHCLFNQYGQKLTSYLTDASQVTTYGVECNLYTPVVTTEGFEKNNKLLTSYNSPQAQNYIRNMSLEQGATNWLTNSAASGAFSVDSSHSYIGSKSGKLYRASASNTQPEVYQTNTLPAGSYTFSGYIRTSGLTGDGVCLLLRTSANSTGVKSRVVTGTTTTANEDGWQKLSVTYEISSETTVVSAVCMLPGTKGTVYFDALQLERGDVANPPNMIENSNMESAFGWGGPRRW